MSGNASIDFLEMLKRNTLQAKSDQNSGSAYSNKNKENNGINNIMSDNSISVEKTSNELIAVIDTETNWHDQVMSIGIAIADSASYKSVDTSYYIIDPEYRVGGIYSNVLNLNRIKRQTACESQLPGLKQLVAGRSQVMMQIRDYLTNMGVNRIFAYNAKFDYGHLPELRDYEWYDIMRLAAYRQYNKAITDDMACCKTGRLKTSYGVEPITRMLSGDNYYCEVHNAVYDAVDELRIIELLRLPTNAYQVGRI